MPDQTHLVSLLVAIPMLTGIICVALVRRPWLSRILGRLSLLTTTGIAVGLMMMVNQSDATGGVLVSQSGSWPAPFGISLIFDRVSGPLVLTTLVVALMCMSYATSSMPAAIERRYFHPLMHFIVMGVVMSFLTGDVFNLFVAFEVMLMSSYALLVLGTGRPQLLQAYKYLLLNLLASTIFVMAAGMLYGLTGTLNMADLARIVQEAATYEELRGAGINPELANVKPLPTGFTALGVLLLLVFGTKAALFPLWFWLPDAYPSAPPAILAFFGGVLTKVGVYAILRLYPMAMAAGDETDLVLDILRVSATLSMVFAVLGALAYRSVRRILCMLLIGGVGLMGFGIVAMTPESLSGTLYYMIQSMVVITVLLMCSGLIRKHVGSDDIRRLSGLARRDVLLATMFFLGMIGVVGLPPTSGFVGKMMVVRAGWDAGHTGMAITTLVTGGLMLLAVLRIWGAAMWGPPMKNWKEDEVTIRHTCRSAYFSTAVLSALALIMGLAAGPLLRWTNIAGQQLLEPRPYIHAVLGDAGVRRIDAGQDLLQQQRLILNADGSIMPESESELESENIPATPDADREAESNETTPEVNAS